MVKGGNVRDLGLFRVSIRMSPSRCRARWEKGGENDEGKKSEEEDEEEERSRQLDDARADS
jgi:hypothetical protein